MIYQLIQEALGCTKSCYFED